MEPSRDIPYFECALLNQITQMKWHENNNEELVSEFRECINPFDLDTESWDKLNNLLKIQQSKESIGLMKWKVSVNSISKLWDAYPKSIVDVAMESIEEIKRTKENLEKIKTYLNGIKFAQLLYQVDVGSRCGQRVSRAIYDPLCCEQLYSFIHKPSAANDIMELYAQTDGSYRMEYEEIDEEKGRAENSRGAPFSFILSQEMVKELLIWATEVCDLSPQKAELALAEKPRFSYLLRRNTKRPCNIMVALKRESDIIHMEFVRTSRDPLVYTFKDSTFHSLGEIKMELDRLSDTIYNY